MKIAKAPPNLYPKPELSWSETSTLAEWVIAMIKANKQNSAEFQAALGIFGREKFIEIWKTHQANEAKLKEKNR